MIRQRSLSVIFAGLVVGVEKMTEDKTEDAHGASILSRALQVILTVAFGFIVYSQGVGAYTGTQEAMKLKAVADNAAVKQKAESVLLSGQAKTSLEVARNAALRTKGEADAVSAEADKIEAEARTLKEKAIYADQKARADAITIENESASGRRRRSRRSLRYAICCPERRARPNRSKLR